MQRSVAITGALAVIIGAFGAHTLKAKLSPEALNTFETGVKYHFYHAIAMFMTWLLYLRQGQSQQTKAFWSFAIGILLFSGSLYFIATRELHQISMEKLGILTPIGGIFFIGGWIFLGLSDTIKAPKEN